MDADEERNFAALLSQSTALPARPTWSPPASSSNQALDPWANPFASSPTDPFSNPPIPAPFSSAPSADGYLPPASKGFEDYSYNGNNGFEYNPPAPAAYTTPSAALDATEEADSPYVQKLEQEQIIPSSTAGLPDPPSVIAARERESLGWGNEAGGFGDGFGGATGNGFTVGTRTYQTPSPPRSWDTKNSAPSPPAKVVTPPKAPPKVGGRILPSDLIDEDLMAASDPSISLKRAFVKSAPAPSAKAGKTPEKPKSGAYVFRPAGKSSPVKHKAEEKKAEEKKVESAVKEEVPEKVAVNGTGEKENGQAAVEGNGDKVQEASANGAGEVEEKAEENQPEETAKMEHTETSEDTTVNAENGQDEIKVETDEVRDAPSADTTTPSTQPAPEAIGSPSPPSPTARSASPTPTPTPDPPPASIPLPASAIPTRTSTPLPPRPSSPAPSIYPAQTPTHDRVAVSPLEPPSAAIGESGDFGFRSLSIGGSGVMPPMPADEGWGGGGSGSGGGSRFGGKGWGAMDSANDDEGLFGRGGPFGDPWGGGGAGSWGGEDTAVAGPSSPATVTAPFEDEAEPQNLAPSTPTPSNPSQSPSKPRRKIHPVFSISISDPARVGDPVRGYTVYTIRTHTTSPHYRKSDFTALRRFSDFLWLFDSLIANNPGIIVPPVPDKHTFGRFQEQFIETRRLALERSLNKIASHPVLQLDPDLRLFLESDNFSVEIKGRRPDLSQDVPAPKSSGGLLGGWSAPKFVESDDWFTSRNAFLDGLENQLKALSKAIDVASRSRLDMATAYAEVADSLQALADSDLGSAMCDSLAKLGELARREKEGAEELAKGDVVNLLNMADEYVRTVGSVRKAMSGRVKVWLAWQAQEKEVGRLKSVREKARVQGKLGDRAAQTLAEINEVDRRSRALQQEYETQTKLVKSEFGRFERERVDEFKRVLERYLEDQIARQREMIMAWEDYHVGVLTMVKKAQGSRGEAGGATGQRA